MIRHLGEHKQNTRDQELGEECGLGRVGNREPVREFKQGLKVGAGGSQGSKISG